MVKKVKIDIDNETSTVVVTKAKSNIIYVSSKTKLFQGGIESKRSPIAQKFTHVDYQMIKCIRRNMLYTRKTIESNILRMPSTYYTKNLDYVFSSHWDLRIMAELGGYEYRGGRLGSGS